jgi:hypothetical protein
VVQQRLEASTWLTEESSLAAVQGHYPAMTSFFHAPFSLACHDVADGRGVIGQAKLFSNFSSRQAGRESKVQDQPSGGWDMGMPRAFRFCYAPDSEADDGGGISAKRTEIMGTMLKRDLIRAQYWSL